jgi:hypothetical protein
MMFGHMHSKVSLYTTVNRVNCLKFPARSQLDVTTLMEIEIVTVSDNNNPNIFHGDRRLSNAKR